MSEVKESNELVLFENNRIRRQEYNDEWYYSIVDIIEILTESSDPNAYWRKLKQRLNDEGNESVIEKQFSDLFKVFLVLKLNLLSYGLPV